MYLNVSNNEHEVNKSGITRTSKVILYFLFFVLYEKMLTTINKPKRQRQKNNNKVTIRYYINVLAFILISKKYPLLIVAKTQQRVDSF